MNKRIFYLSDDLCLLISDVQGGVNGLSLSDQHDECFEDNTVSTDTAGLVSSFMNSLAGIYINMLFFLKPGSHIICSFDMEKRKEGVHSEISEDGYSGQPLLFGNPPSIA